MLYGAQNYKKFLHESEILLTGIVQGRVKTLSYFQSTVTVDNVDFPLAFHVVPSETLNVDVILGIDLINQAEVRIDKDGITITKPNVSIYLSQIELQPEKEEAICSGTRINEEAKNIAEAMMRVYKPNLSKTTDIELSVTLKDETPIFQAAITLERKGDCRKSSK